MAIFINEWLPNPIGSDTCKVNCGWNIEFVELVNNGAAPVSLNEWSLWTGGKAKKLSLSGFVVPAHGYVIVKKPAVKISLKNNDGGLWLYGPDGALADAAAFKGVAPEGKSFSRIDYGAADIQHFAFVDPTPDAANNTINNEIAVQHYPTGVPLNAPLAGSDVFGLMFGATIVILAAWAYIIYTNEAISNIFFPRDREAR